VSAITGISVRLGRNAQEIPNESIGAIRRIGVLVAAPSELLLE
jgi:hypothetical protein